MSSALDSQQADEGKQLLARKAYAKALPLLCTALEQQPDHLPTLTGICECLAGLNKLPELALYLQRLESLAPEDINTRFFAALTDLRHGRIDTARAALIAVLNQNPAYYDAALALSHIYLKQNAAVKAELLLETVTGCESIDENYFLNLGTARLMQARFAEAEADFRAGLKINSSNPKLLNSLAHLLLRAGNFSAGWQLYENRHSFISTISTPPANSRYWQGENLGGSTLYLLNEQGFGDTIFGAGYFQTLSASARQLMVECPPELKSLFKHSFPQIKFIDISSHPPACDFHLPIMSLPRLLDEGKVRAFPDSPYLKVDRGKKHSFRQALSSVTAFKVGIAWQGRPAYGLDTFRSFNLAEFTPLARLPGIQLISLQKGDPGKSQIQEFQLYHTLMDADSLSPDDRDFHDTAAIIRNLDLVITSDTSVAHLAGALGARVWLILGEIGDWRWFNDTDQSYWYPSMRIFRKQVNESWQPVFEQVRQALSLLPEQQD